MTTPPYPPVSDADLAVLREQLGRPARGVVGIAARCVCGNPTVVATSPRLPDGTPFPTFYYLTHPAATAAMSVLEADHVMRAAIVKLFRDEPDTREIIKLKAIFEILETITDRCADVANIIEGIVLEYS